MPAPSRCAANHGTPAHPLHLALVATEIRRLESKLGLPSEQPGDLDRVVSLLHTARNHAQIETLRHSLAALSPLIESALPDKDQR